MELASVEQITSKPLPWKEVLVIPIGDIQLQQNEDATDLNRLKAIIKYGVEHDAFFIGMGDFIDMESPSNRRALQESGVYDSVIDALDAKAEQLEQELMDIMKPTIGRWLGLLEGHHYHVHQDGTTTDVRFAQYLKAPFLGTCAYVNLSFKPPSNHHPVRNVTIWAHHGRGGGKMMSTSINQLEGIIRGFDADIYLVGHHHRANAARTSRIYPIFGNRYSSIANKEMIIATTGSFLKGYLPGYKRNGRASGLYPERGMMNPLALGAIKLYIRPYWRKDAFNSGSTPDIEINAEV